MDIKQEIEALREELQKHNPAYYENDAPPISAFESAALLRQLEDAQ